MDTTQDQEMDTPQANKLRHEEGSIATRGMDTPEKKGEWIARKPGAVGLHRAGPHR